MKFEDIYNKILEQLKQTCAGINENDIDGLIEEIFKSKKIFIGGAGRSLLMMRSLAMRLMQFGFNSYVVGDTTTPAIREGDLLILGTNSGETKNLKSYCAVAKENNARISVITSNPQSTIGKQADNVVVFNRIIDEEKIQSSGSTFEQSLLIFCDALIVKIYQTGRLGNEEVDKFIRIRHANLE
ncbi:MAG: SIS domain-containing protein [Erysipelotrichia bacterium]|nr:SIS domain-containing protein [Erysipelotrichia bacterium]